MPDPTGQGAADPGFQVHLKRAFWDVGVLRGSPMWNSWKKAAIGRRLGSLDAGTAVSAIDHDNKNRDDSTVL